MSTLVVLAFDEPHNAEEVRLKLQKLQNEYLLDLADVVVAVKDKAGEAKLHHATNLIPDDMVFQGFCGSYATTGAASGTLAAVGINDHFMKTLTSMLTLGNSALFVLTRTPTPSKDRLLEELRGLGGKVLMTSLSHEDASRLQAALSAPKLAGS